MAAVPQPLNTLARAIYGLYERQEAREVERPYLGASILGEACDRRLWLNFRWVDREQFDGRMLRLFDTGHREEARLLNELRQLSIQVVDRMPDGSQYAVSAHGGHFRGHLDAVVLGLPEAPKTWHLLDVKTVKASKLAELRRNGFAKTYPKYWAQGQIYMGLAELTRAMFVFVCKDDETIHEERFSFDEKEFNRLMERAGRIIFAAEPPPPISTDPAWWTCKFCPFHSHCHGTAAPAATCRSCAHVTPMADGTWQCEQHEKTLAVDAQRAGCPDHLVIPSLLSRWATLIDGDGNSVRYRNELTGREFVNGPPQAGYASAEFAACEDKQMIGDPVIKNLRDEFEASHV